MFSFSHGWEFSTRVSTVSENHQAFLKNRVKNKAVYFLMDISLKYILNIYLDSFVYFCYISKLIDMLIRDIHITHLWLRNSSAR